MNQKEVQKECSRSEAAQQPLKHINNEKDDKKRRQKDLKEACGESQISQTKNRKTTKHEDDEIRTEGETKMEDTISEVWDGLKKPTLRKGKNVRAGEHYDVTSFIPIIKKFSLQFVPEYFLDILKYMLAQERESEWFDVCHIQRWRYIMTTQGANFFRKVRNLQVDNSSTEESVSNLSTETRPKINWEVQYDCFASIIEEILQIVYDPGYENCVFPTCYLLYMLLISDPQTTENLSNVFNRQRKEKKIIQYYLVTILFISTKYFEIYPFDLQELMDLCEEDLHQEQILELESLILTMNDFSQYFNQHEATFLNMFGQIVQLDPIEVKECMFILESGLSNVQLYSYRPSFKASAVITFHEMNKSGKHEKADLIRKITGITRYEERKIIRHYKKAIEYNRVNRKKAQTQKYYFEPQNTAEQTPVTD